MRIPLFFKSLFFVVGFACNTPEEGVCGDVRYEVREGTVGPDEVTAELFEAGADTGDTAAEDDTGDTGL